MADILKIARGIRSHDGGKSAEGGVMEALFVPFGYDTLVKAMVAAALVGGVGGLLSCYVILKGWSLMGDALSHAVVPGVAVAYFFGLPLALGAFAAGMLAVAGMGVVKARTRLKEDAVIGVVFTAFFALGLLLISLRPSGISLRTIIFGNLLGIDPGELRQLAWICAGVGAVVLLRWKDLMWVSFDPGHARAMGVKVAWWQALLLAMLSLVCVAGLQVVGAILVVALLVTPGATAYLLTRRFGRMLWVAMGLGAGLSFLGTWLSYFVNGSVGGCIVLLQTLVFFAVMLVKSRTAVAGRPVERRA
jgi:ABC-type Mn2+/Zn2+ transport system permease subunit